jgi:G3E family GTPase
MNLLSIAGFLGSGKTTLLLRVAREFSSRFSKIAIIENEIGEIGIDSQYLRKQGLEIQELFGGCICCVMQLDLIETIKKVEQVVKPDWIILEPTGAADPGDVGKAVRQYSPSVEFICNVVLLDAPRFKMFSEIMIPMLTAQMNAADIVAINKIDEVDSVEVKNITRRVGQLTNGADIVPICAEDGTGVTGLIELVLNHD